MSEQKKEPWRELCELAAVEQDQQKLHELVKEIIRALEAREQPSQHASSRNDSTTHAAGQLDQTQR
jgi:hypothetical protein